MTRTGCPPRRRGWQVEARRRLPRLPVPGSRPASGTTRVVPPSSASLHRRRRRPSVSPSLALPSRAVRLRRRGRPGTLRPHRHRQTHSRAGTHHGNRSRRPPPRSPMVVRPRSSAIRFPVIPVTSIPVRRRQSRTTHRMARPRRSLPQVTPDQLSTPPHRQAKDHPRPHRQPLSPNRLPNPTCPVPLRWGRNSSVPGQRVQRQPPSTPRSRSSTISRTSPHHPDSHRCPRRRGSTRTRRKPLNRLSLPCHRCHPSGRDAPHLLFHPR